MMNLISFCDGNHSLLEIANIINEPFEEIFPLAVKLIDNGIIEIINKENKKYICLHIRRYPQI